MMGYSGDDPAALVVSRGVSARRADHRELLVEIPGRALLLAVEILSPRRPFDVVRARPAERFRRKLS